jgi:branched-chain amino acid transport system permease protein
MEVAATAAERTRVDLPAVVKNAAFAALVTLVLAFPLVGLQTVDQGANALIIRTRFDWVAYGVIAVFLGRLGIGYWLAVRRSRPMAAAAGSGALSKLAAAVSRHSMLIGAVGFLFAATFPFLPFSTNYIVDLGTNVLIYVMLGWGLNVVVGLAGLLDLGYVAFYAVGAYSFALFAQWFHLTFWEALPISGILAATFGVVLGFPVLRLRGDYLAIVTLGFGEIIRIILTNWSDVTGGPNGINGIPRPSFFGMPFLNPDNAPDGVITVSQFFGIEFNSIQRVIFLYYVILILALLTNAFTLRLRKLPIGRAWEALREDEIACRALGLNPRNIKLSSFAIGAMLGGFAGSFFATRLSFISPESFTFLESAIVLAIVVLGGMGSQLGVVLSATVLVMLNEFGRWFNGVPLLEDVGRFRMLIFGAAMIAIMIWRPRGLLAHREPSIRLHGKGGPKPAAEAAE